MISSEQGSLNGVGRDLTFSMELGDRESNKKRKIEEAKEDTEALLPFCSTEEEKDSATSSFDTALQEDDVETAVIDKGAAVIDNKEGVVPEEKELSIEDNVKVATYTDLTEQKESEHDSKVLSTEQRSLQERNEAELKIREKVIKIFGQENKMDYLKFEEMMESGEVTELTEDHRVDEGSLLAFHVNPYAAADEARERFGLPYKLDRGTGDYTAFAASFTSKYKKGSTKDYWKGHAPVLKKCDYNGE